MRGRLRFCLAAGAALVVLGASPALGGPTGSCGTTKEADGATAANAVITTLSTDGNNVKYRSGTMYAELGPDGFYGHRDGATAGEPPPASSIEWKVTPSGACVASPKLGQGYQVP